MVNGNPTTRTTIVAVQVTVEIEVNYAYTPGTEGVPFLPNGDPGYPGEEGHCEITEATGKIWYEDHLVLADEKYTRHLLESSLRNREHEETIQKQLLKDCEDDDDAT